MLEERLRRANARVLRYRLLMKVFATVTRNVISAIVYTERCAYKFPLRDDTGGERVSIASYI